jgi:hypothetical protein
MAGTEQYRPIASLETAADQGYSVRATRDQEENLNNAQIYVFANPIVNIPCIPAWYSFDNNDDENVIGMSAPVRIPEPYDKLAWISGNKRTSGTSDDIVWTLYSTGWRYYGDGIMDTTALSGDYDSTTITCSSGTHDVPAAATLDVVRGVNGYCWLVLTAKNDTTSDRGYISTITVWPYMST